MKKVHVGLIGFGLSGRYFQAPYLHSHHGFEIITIQSSRRKEIKELHPTLHVVLNEDEIFKDASIDLVIISTPNHTHYPLAKKALLHNKHVLIEKPFVNTPTEGEELIALAKKQRKILTAFHNRRWDGDFLTIKKIIESGRLGRIVEFESHFDRYRPILNTDNWRTGKAPGNGVFYDLGSHLIDQALALFGKPNSLFADIRIAREVGEVDDTFELILFYEKLRVILKAGILVKELGPRFSIHGTNGSFVKYGLDNQEKALREGLPIDSVDWGLDKEENYGILNTAHREKVVTERGNYMALFDNVYKAITQGVPLVIQPEIALENIRLIELAFESNKLGKKVSLGKILT